jgi:hypothetical protein
MQAKTAAFDRSSMTVADGATRAWPASRCREPTDAPARGGPLVSAGLHERRPPCAASLTS